MKKLVKLGMFAFLGLALATGLVACSDDDPDYGNVTPPTVAASHSVSGRVTGMDGNGLSATVTMNGTSTQTNADGTFLFENVATGTYTLTAAADGKQMKETTINVTESGSGANVVWNVALPAEGKTVAVSATGDTETAVTSETIEGNEDAAVTVDVTVPEAALPEGSSVVITPVYNLDEAEDLTRVGSRAAESVMLIGTNVQCADEDAALNKAIELNYTIDADVAKSVKAQKFVNGQWVDAEFTVEGNKVTVVADEITSYALLLDAEVTSTSSSVALAFQRDEWDNLYGANDMSVEAASFTYHIGTEITASGSDKVTAYLIEVLARLAGSSVMTATGSYPVNVTLPIGTALNISGTQQVTNLTVSALNHSVSGKQYGDLSFKTTTYNRNHNGGTGGSAQ